MKLPKGYYAQIFGPDNRQVGVEDSKFDFDGFEMYSDDLPGYLYNWAISTIGADADHIMKEHYGWKK